MTKTVSNPTPNVGDTITFTVTLTNNGPNNATNVTGTGPAAGGADLRLGDAQPGDVRPGDGGLDRWHVWPAASSADLTIQATVVSPNPTTNTATITHADQFDPNPGNNTASATETPQQADLAVTKSVSNSDPQRRRHDHLHRHGRGTTAPTPRPASRCRTCCRRA